MEVGMRDMFANLILAKMSFDMRAVWLAIAIIGLLVIVISSPRKRALEQRRWAW